MYAGIFLDSGVLLTDYTDAFAARCWDDCSIIRLLRICPSTLFQYMLCVFVIHSASTPRIAVLSQWILVQKLSLPACLLIQCLLCSGTHAWVTLFCLARILRFSRYSQTIYEIIWWNANVPSQSKTTLKSLSKEGLGIAVSQPISKIEFVISVVILASPEVFCIDFKIQWGHV